MSDVNEVNQADFDLAQDESTCAIELPHAFQKSRMKRR
jgi:hypothetical protein